MLPHALQACPETPAQRITRIAQAPAAQALAAQAPPLTSEQTAKLRAVFSAAPLAVAA